MTAEVQPRAAERAADVLRGDFSWSHRFGMHCAGCHAAAEQPEFDQAEPITATRLIGDFRVGLHMIPGHEITGRRRRSRRLDRAEHKVGASRDVPSVDGRHHKGGRLRAGSVRRHQKHCLRVVAGVRYDGKTKLFDAKTSPRLSLVYTPNDKLVVRGGYSDGVPLPDLQRAVSIELVLHGLHPRSASPPFPLSVFKPNSMFPPEGQHLGPRRRVSDLTGRSRSKADYYRSARPRLHRHRAALPCRRRCADSSDRGTSRPTRGSPAAWPGGWPTGRGDGLVERRVRVAWCWAGGQKKAVRTDPPPGSKRCKQNIQVCATASSCNSVSFGGFSPYGFTRWAGGPRSMRVTPGVTRIDGFRPRPMFGRPGAPFVGGPIPVPCVRSGDDDPGARVMSR